MEQRSNKLTIGADMELFLAEGDTIIPCVGIIPGTKEKPMQLPNAAKGFMAQEDNVMVEFNIPPVDVARHDPSEYIHNAIIRTERYLKTINPEYNLVRKDQHTFTEEQLMSPQAQLIGCEPDNNAYEMGQERHPPQDIGNERTCGAHIHIGGNFNCPDFVAALFMDLALATANVHRPQENRSWYRQPGIYRSKPYGIEYRSLGSNILQIKTLPKTLCGVLTRDTYMPVLGTSIYVARSVGNWLINTGADDILKLFKQVNWTVVHRYLLGENDLRAYILEYANACVEGGLRI